MAPAVCVPTESQSFLSLAYKSPAGNFLFARSLTSTTTLENKFPEEEEESTQKTTVENGEEKPEDPKPIDERKQLLEGALTYVNQLGWSEAALAEAAKEAGLSQAVLGIFPRKEAELVEYFMEASRLQLSEELTQRALEFESLPARQRLVAAIRERLELQAPYMSSWPQALSIQARPNNVPTTLKQRWELMDVLWETVGDQSEDMERHGKRLLLAGAYSAAEVYMLTDFSPGYDDTWRFLERQVDCVLELKKTVNEVSHVAQAVGAGLANTISNLLKGQLPKAP